jgi:hypothetical protein
MCVRLSLAADLPLGSGWLNLRSLRSNFRCAVSSRKADQAFRMAALPAGYVYRLASPTLLSIGVVLSKAAGRLTPQDIERYIRSAGAGWVIEDLRPLDSIQTGRGGIASVQWSSGLSPMLRVGDALLGETRYQLKAYAQAYPTPLCYCAKLVVRTNGRTANASS